MNIKIKHLESTNINTLKELIDYMGNMKGLSSGVPKDCEIEVTVDEAPKRSRIIEEKILLHMGDRIKSAVEKLVSANESNVESGVIYLFIDEIINDVIKGNT